MNKQAAKKLAQSETLSFGDLRAKIAARRGVGGMSAVNPSIPLEQVLDIYDGALAGRDDAEVPKAWRTVYFGRTPKEKPTRDVLIITNILRDCA